MKDIETRVAVAENTINTHAKILNEHQRKLDSFQGMISDFKHLNLQIKTFSENLVKLNQKFDEMETRKKENLKKEVEVTRQEKRQLIFNIINYVVLGILGVALFKLGLMH